MIYHIAIVNAEQNISGINLQKSAPTAAGRASAGISIQLDSWPQPMNKG